MQIKYFFLFFFVAFFSLTASSQDLYKVFFLDKNGVSFTPYNYFDAKTIERRQNEGISLNQPTDFPVRDDYITAVEQITGNTAYPIRWFNLVFTQATDRQIETLKRLPFVTKIQKSDLQTKPASINYGTTLSPKDEKLLNQQILHLEGNLFAKANITGRGMRIAIFDAGFPGTDTNPAFEHIRKNKRIIKTWDFAKNKESVYAHNKHGTMVLSCIAGIIDGKQIGLATDAEFLLARTEVASEPFSEEKNWLQAVEWADKNGADIINSSLGYTFHRYFPWEMNGETSLVAKAANMAASKGILVVNAMGNDGSKDWKVLGTPADADSIISVGGINPETGFHQSFSSFGPTSDFRLKPNVSAFSTAIVAGKDKLQRAQGTSFSSPLIAGFVACAWQAMKKENINVTNMNIFKEIEKSGNLYPYYDYAHGYGIPQASYFLHGKKKIDSTCEISKQENTIYIRCKKDFIRSKGKNQDNYLLVHVANNKGVLLKYWLVEVYQEDAFSFDLKEFPKGKIIRAHFHGFTTEFEVK